MELGNVPVLILGDLNIEPELSPVIRAAVATKRWVDAEAAMSCWYGRPPRPTCYASSESPSRIDVCLCSSTLARSLEAVDVLLDTGIPTHTPLQIDFNFDPTAGRVNRLPQPCRFAMEEWEDWSDESVATLT